MPDAPPRGCLVDASLALKWYLPVEREPDGALARSLIGRLPLRTTQLAVHEIGNVLVRRSGWDADRIAAALDLLIDVCGDPLPLTPGDYLDAVRLALEHELTFYDASYAAIARRADLTLLSADSDLVAPGLATPLAGAPA